MKARSFTVGRRSGYDFAYDPEGGLTALPAADGKVRVIGGQLDLHGEVEQPESWSAVQEATGNNAKISDGTELYAGAGFGDPLIDGQVQDVLWALGDRASQGPGRLLELGCGPGFLLEALGRRMPGWHMVGIDPSPVSVQQARSRGLDCTEGFLATVDIGGGFDAVVVMGNFQLHPDPGATLAGLADRSAPGALLYLDSKNPATSARRVAARVVGAPLVNRVGPVHAFAAHAFHGIRNAPSRGQLDRLLRENGWVADEIRTVGPRLLRFSNTHNLAHGLRGQVWRALDGLDSGRGERAWIQARGHRA